MRKLLSTTALVAALGFPVVALAQTAGVAGDQVQQQQQHAGTAGFLAERSQSDIFASELMGRTVYALRTRATGDEQMGQRQATGQDQLRLMNRAYLDGLDNIGQVTDIVLSSDGQVRAIVIGVGGFLGMGQRDVAVTMDQVSFAADADDNSQLYVVVLTGADMLQDSPAYDRTAMRGHRTQDATGATGDQQRTALTAPAMTRDGYQPVEATNVTTEMLVGSSVYGVDDNNVGTVQDLLLDANGAISHVIIDFGGFLGIGSSQVSIAFDELTILSDAGYSDVRLYIDATKEQVQSLPQYRAVN